jgi:hypothetical protein
MRYICNGPPSPSTVGGDAMPCQWGTQIYIVYFLCVWQFLPFLWSNKLQYFKMEWETRKAPLWETCFHYIIPAAKVSLPPWTNFFRWYSNGEKFFCCYMLSRSLSDSAAVLFKIQIATMRYCNKLATIAILFLSSLGLSLLGCVTRKCKSIWSILCAVFEKPAVRGNFKCGFAPCMGT